jgi:hypothetical protein
VSRQRLGEFQEARQRLATEGERLAQVTSTVEVLREKGDSQTLAMLYDSIGNEDLRDKAIEAALSDDPSDSNICFLRGMQGRPDLIPEAVAERRLAHQLDSENWSQRARTLINLDRPIDATKDYLKSALNDIEEGNLFSAAYYLKEMVSEGCIDALFKEAFDDAAAEGDIWWQIRALDELGWDEELQRFLLDHVSEVEALGHNMALIELRRAEGNWVEVDRLVQEHYRTMQWGVMGEDDLDADAEDAIGGTGLFEGDEECD